MWKLSAMHQWQQTATDDESRSSEFLHRSPELCSRVSLLLPEMRGNDKVWQFVGFLCTFTWTFQQKQTGKHLTATTRALKSPWSKIPFSSFLVKKPKTQKTKTKTKQHNKKKQKPKTKNQNHKKETKRYYPFPPQTKTEMLRVKHLWWQSARSRDREVAFPGGSRGWLGWPQTRPLCKRHSRCLFINHTVGSRDGSFLQIQKRRRGASVRREYKKYTSQINVRFFFPF